MTITKPLEQEMFILPKTNRTFYIGIGQLTGTMRLYI